jgi:hypothetical protein
VQLPPRRLAQRKVRPAATDAALIDAAFGVATNLDTNLTIASGTEATSAAA